MLSGLHAQPTNVLQFVVKVKLKNTQVKPYREPLWNVHCKRMTHSDGGHEENHKAQ